MNTSYLSHLEHQTVGMSVMIVYKFSLSQRAQNIDI